MKKMISMLLALAMVFTFAACSSTPEILGVYEAEFDLTEDIVNEFNSGAEITDSDVSLGNHLDDFTITMVFEFHEDGTYSQYIAPESLEVAIKNLRDATVLVTDDILLYAFAKEFSAYGENVETREDVEALLHMDWDSIIVNVFGASMEELVDTMMETLDVDSMFEDATLEGNYEAKNGKLFLSDGLEYSIDETVYETYEIDGDVVTITGGVNTEENEFITYPYTMTKISE